MLIRMVDSRVTYSVTWLWYLSSAVVSEVKYFLRLIRLKTACNEDYSRVYNVVITVTNNYYPPKEGKMETIDPADLDAIITASARRLMKMPVTKRAKVFARVIQRRGSWLTAQIITKLLAEPDKTLRIMSNLSPPSTTS